MGRQHGKSWQNKRRRLSEAQKGLCWWCGVVMTKRAGGGAKKKCPATSVTIDHVIPLGDGGTNDISNLVASCSGCNQQRNNIDMKRRTGKVVSMELESFTTRSIEERPTLPVFIKPKPSAVPRNEVVERLADRIERMMDGTNR
jgi:hypothetical protein